MSADSELLIKKKTVARSKVDPDAMSNKKTINDDQHRSQVDLKKKKITTKDMIQETLSNLKTRKGVSLQAIKKYMSLNYDYDTVKLAHLLKKQIQAGLEEGTILQVKGVGISGSFKLVAVKNKPEKPKKENKPTKTKDKIEEKPTKGEQAEKPKPKVMKSKQKNTEKETETLKSKEKAVKVVQKKTTKNKLQTKEKAPEDSEKPPKIAKMENVDKQVKKAKSKMASVKHTPAKKRAAMMKRKSLGSILKTPKMKPKRI